MSTRWCCNTVKRNERRNEIRFSNRQHKIQKKTCINRHIIKYYVVTEHILFHGVAMETDFWRMRRSFADLPPLIHWPVTVVRASSTSAQSIRINRKHVSKETIAKNIKSFLQERERERERTRRETAWKWLAEILVYSPSFHNLCCQYLTGSWQGRPGCDYLLLWVYTQAASVSVCACICHREWLFLLFFVVVFWGVCGVCLRGSTLFSYSLCVFFLPGMSLVPGRQMSVFSHRGNKAVMASHLLQYLGKATEVAVRKMLGLPQVQDHSSGAGFGGKVVKIPKRVIMWNQREVG